VARLRTRLVFRVLTVRLLGSIPFW
ncbi:hypothetical protein A2U01_0068017, partial [Trifolium medium]|nr:hypothetical protein [Trifolium medium]